MIPESRPISAYPIRIRGRQFAVPDDLTQAATRRIRFALGRLAARIDNVDVCVSDENGTRGGHDKLCTIRVHLGWAGQVIVSGRGAHVAAAVGQAAKRAAGVAHRELKRRWTLKRKGGARADADQEEATHERCRSPSSGVCAQ